jgi:hypothetical protein
MNQVLHVLRENTSEIRLRKESSGPYCQRNRYFVMYYKYSSLSYHWLTFLFYLQEIIHCTVVDLHVEIS